jgi:hypothetical protein
MSASQTPSRSNPEADAERNECPNKMLFYALDFTITFFVGFLYLPASTSQDSNRDR